VTKATGFIISVEYTEGLDQAASRASYDGTTVRVSYGPNVNVSERFATGDFENDYWTAIGRVIDLRGGDADVPVMASSTLTFFEIAAGYDMTTIAEMDEDSDALDAMEAARR